MFDLQSCFFYKFQNIFSTNIAFSSIKLPDNLMKILSFTTLLLFVLCNHLFAQNTKTNPVKKYAKNVEAQGAKSVQMELRQSAGTLKISGGASQLMEAMFAFTEEKWKPAISYTKQSNNGKLVVKQPEEKNMNMEDGDHNDWQVRLNNSIPLDLELTIGAGESNIDLHGMKLTNVLLKAGAGKFDINLSNTSLPELKVNAGVGEITIDLTGKWLNDLEAEINGGIGEITLKLPRKTGVRVEVHGLGSIDANGFKKENGDYVNDAYDKTKSNLVIEINGGLGSVNLELEK